MMNFDDIDIYFECDWDQQNWDVQPSNLGISLNIMEYNRYYIYLKPTAWDLAKCYIKMDYIHYSTYTGYVLHGSTFVATAKIKVNSPPRRPYDVCFLHCYCRPHGWSIYMSKWIWVKIGYLNK